MPRKPELILKTSKQNLICQFVVKIMNLITHSKLMTAEPIDKPNLILGEQ